MKLLLSCVTLDNSAAGFQRPYPTNDLPDATIGYHPGCLASLNAPIFSFKTDDE